MFFEEEKYSRNESTFILGLGIIGFDYVQLNLF